MNNIIIINIQNKKIKNKNQLNSNIILYLLLFRK